MERITSSTVTRWLIIGYRSGSLVRLWHPLQSSTRLEILHFKSISTEWRINSSIDYVIIGSDNVIGSDNGLTRMCRQTIIWTNAGKLLIKTLWTNSLEILIKIRQILTRKWIQKCRLQVGALVVSTSMCWKNVLIYLLVFNSKTTTMTVF